MSRIALRNKTIGIREATFRSGTGLGHLPIILYIMRKITNKISDQSCIVIERVAEIIVMRATRKQLKEIIITPVKGKVNDGMKNKH